MTFSYIARTFWWQIWSVHRDIRGFKVHFFLDALDVAPGMFGLPKVTSMRMAFISEGKGAFGSGKGGEAILQM